MQPTHPHHKGDAAASDSGPPGTSAMSKTPQISEAITGYQKQLEQARRERDEKLKKRQAEIATLCADLDRILTHPDPDTEKMDRQADLLDCMLYTVMRHGLHKNKESGTIDYDQIDMALRIQKQCMDTVKTASTIEYMQSITSISTGIYPPLYKEPLIPPPPKNDEQTR